MSDDECARILVLENNQQYDRSRMGEICKKLSGVEKTQYEIMAILMKMKWFCVGCLFLLVADQVGLVKILKAVL